MKKIIIRQKDGTERAGAEMLDPVQWIEQGVAQNWWGKPERWVLENSESYDPSDVLETEARDDSMGLQTWVKLKAEYTIEIIDITQEHALAECIAKRKGEYPTPESFMNAYFDGGDAALETLRQKRLEVKAKYPKPGV